MTSKVSKRTGQGKGKAEFQAKFSRKFIIPNKVTAAIAELGPTGYEEQGEFLKRVGLTPVDLNLCKESFADFWFEARPVGGNSKTCVIWCGSEKFAKELQGLLS